MRCTITSPNATATKAFYTWFSTVYEPQHTDEVQIVKVKNMWLEGKPTDEDWAKKSDEEWELNYKDIKVICLYTDKHTGKSECVEMQ